MYDDIQDRIWEIEKSWRNNLLFHGIRYDDPNTEEDPNRTGRVLSNSDRNHSQNLHTVSENEHGPPSK